MAFKVKKQKNLDTVIMVSRHDSAINHDECDFDEYLKDYDMNKLVFFENELPTKFVLTFKFNADEAASIKNTMMKSFDKTTKQPELSLGSYQQMVARMSLREVQCPDDQPLAERVIIKKSGKYIRDDSLAMLEEYGLVDEIFSCYSTLSNSVETAGNEKN